MNRAVLWTAVLTCAVWFAGARAEVAEPDGYRTEDYRSPVPAVLTGATVLSDDQAHDVWQAGEARFVDVLPRAPKPENLPEGTVWRDKPRHSIPGALWLVDVGYGALADETHAYFKAGLRHATGGDPEKAMVFFCLAECWMSWNAAKRALAYGYTDVSWYPNGTDGWAGNGWPTERIEPFAEP